MCKFKDTTLGIKKFDFSKLLLIVLLAIGYHGIGHAQCGDSLYWNRQTLLFPFRLPPAPIGHTPEYIDLNGDGKPAGRQQAHHLGQQQGTALLQRHCRHACMEQLSGVVLDAEMA